MIRKLTRNVLVYNMVVMARMLVVSSYAYVVGTMFGSTPFYCATKLFRRRGKRETHQFNHMKSPDKAL